MSLRFESPVNLFFIAIEQLLHIVCGQILSTRSFTQSIKDKSSNRRHNRCHKLNKLMTALK